MTRTTTLSCIILLQVLEKDLVAPDVDPEMFAAEEDADSEYIDFLREFYTKPQEKQAPVATVSEAEASEREDDDPDYNIFDDLDQDIEADPEEYQQTRATEVRDLLLVKMALIVDMSNEGIMPSSFRGEVTTSVL